MAKIKPEFDRRNVKIIGLSVDPVGNHARWANDIEETQGHAPELSDHRRRRLQRVDAVRDAARRHLGRSLDRTPADNQTVRNVFVIGPDKKVKLVLIYPMTTGRNFDEVLRVIDSLQLTAKHKVATPAELAAGRRRDHRRLGLRRAGQGDLSGGLGSAAALHPDRPAAALIAAHDVILEQCSTSAASGGYRRPRRVTPDPTRHVAARAETPPARAISDARALRSCAATPASGTWADESNPHRPMITSLITIPRARGWTPHARRDPALSRRSTPMPSRPARWPPVSPADRRRPRAWWPERSHRGGRQPPRG